MFGEQMHRSLLLILLTMLMIWGAMVGSILLLFNPYSNVLHDVEFINVIISGIAAIVEIVIYYFNIGGNLKMRMIFYLFWWKLMRTIFLRTFHKFWFIVRINALFERNFEWIWYFPILINISNKHSFENLISPPEML